MKASLWEITFVYTACKTLKGFRAESFFAEAFSLKYFTDFSKFFSNACFKKWMQNQILNRKNIFVIVFPEIRYSFVIHLKYWFGQLQQFYAEMEPVRIFSTRAVNFKIYAG